MTARGLPRGPSPGCHGAVAAPVIFAGASLVYFGGHPFTTPLQTAIIYTSAVVALDLVVVATFLEKSYAMFAGVLGTWIPFALLFGAACITGALRVK